MTPATMVTKAKTVDEYIELAPKDHQKALRDIRKAIKEAAPDAEEKIGYHMPAYKHHGWLVFFSSFKDHLSLFAVGESNLKRFSSKLKPFEISGQTIHFTPEKPLPATLVKEIVKVRMKENEARSRKKRKIA